MPKKKISKKVDATESKVDSPKKRRGRPPGSKNKPKVEDVKTSKSNRSNKSDSIIKTDTMVRRFTTVLFLDKNPNIIDRVKKMFRKWDKSTKIRGYVIHDKDTYTTSEALEHSKSIEERISQLNDKKKSRKIKKDAYEMQLSMIEAERDLIRAGAPKPAHVHIYMDFGRTTKSLSDICEMLSSETDNAIVSENMIQFVAGKHLHKRIIGALAYLTHSTMTAQEDGKFLYNASDVKMFRFAPKNKSDYNQKILDVGVLTTYHEFLEVYETLKKELEFEGRNYISEILNGTLLPHEVANIDPDYYFASSNQRKLEQARKYYVNEVIPAPSLRFNFYIGPAKDVADRGRIGKSLTGKAFALSQCATLNPTLYDRLYKQSNSDSELFELLQRNKMIFMIGGQGVSFDGYDGEPIVMFDDCRAENLLKIFGTRDALLTFFDPPYTRQALNVKFGNIVLKNMITIINGYAPYDEFIKGLSTTAVKRDMGDGVRTYHEYESTSQIRGRIPFIWHIASDIVTSEVQLQYMIGSNAHDVTRRFPNNARIASQFRQSELYGRTLMTDFTEKRPVIEEHYKGYDVNNEPIEINFNEITDISDIRYREYQSYCYKTYSLSQWELLDEYIRHADTHGAKEKHNADWAECYIFHHFYDKYPTGELVDEMRQYIISRYLDKYASEYDVPTEKYTLKINERDTELLRYTNPGGLGRYPHHMRDLMNFIRDDFREYLELAKRYNQ